MKKALIAVIALASAWAGAARSGALVDLALVDRATGERIPVHAYRGRAYAAGSPGSKYSLVITNRTGERVLAVTSVDGVNVITGETASPAQSGYVLDPWGNVEVSGWRKSMSEVAAFVFTPLPDSYAARTDRPGNVGVIGVAVFREYQPPRIRDLQQQPEQLSGPRSERQDSASGLGSMQRAPAPMREEKLGTGHGEREPSYANWTDFRRASDRPAELVSIWYDSRANLVARGIIRDRPYAEPSPFPGFRFAPDPRS